MSFVEVFLFALTCLVGFIAYQAHHKHNVFVAQVKSDIADLRARLQPVYPTVPTYTVGSGTGAAAVIVPSSTS